MLAFRRENRIIVSNDDEPTSRGNAIIYPGNPHSPNLVTELNIYSLNQASSFGQNVPFEESNPYLQSADEYL